MATTDAAVSASVAVAVAVAAAANVNSDAIAVNDTVMNCQAAWLTDCASCSPSWPTTPSAAPLAATATVPSADPGPADAAADADAALICN